jgi:hypothetical protein
LNEEQYLLHLNQQHRVEVLPLHQDRILILHQIIDHILPLLEVVIIQLHQEATIRNQDPQGVIIRGLHIHLLEVQAPLIRGDLLIQEVQADLVQGEALDRVLQDLLLEEDNNEKGAFSSFFI